jgi:prevent-host-death family protein
MTLHPDHYEVGVRELHDRLSEHLERVQQGSQLLVTRHGRPIARLSAVDSDDTSEDLAKRGLIQPATHARGARRAHIDAVDSVSDLVAEQRR